MKAGNSKKKGSNFERNVCKQLSLWVSGGKSEDLYWRSSMSGGRATVGKRAGRTIRQCGDICAVEPEGHVLTNKFMIECKHVKDLNLDAFLIEGTGPLAAFWKKCKAQAAEHNRYPMLIARQNRRLILVVTEPETLRSVCEEQGSVTKYPEVRSLASVLGYKFRPGGSTQRSAVCPVCLKSLSSSPSTNWKRLSPSS